MKRACLLLTILSGAAFQPVASGQLTFFQYLYNFSTAQSETNSSPPHFPLGQLLLEGSTLYGTSPSGGIWTNGAVYSCSLDGSGFTNLHSFHGAAGSQRTNNEGTGPTGGLTQAGVSLYGTTSSGGNSGNGTLFSLNTDGTGFSTLHSFGNTSAGTNSDGANPYGSLLSGGSVLYGTTQNGGPSGNGTVFAINTDGTGFTVLHGFTGGSGGAHPTGNLVQFAFTLFGTAPYGGNVADGKGFGVVYAVNTDGTGFRIVHAFSAASGNALTNTDGAWPFGGLAFRFHQHAPAILYGATWGGGQAGLGTVFAVSIDGSNFTTLHSFDVNNNDGRNPEAGLLLFGNSLYGTTPAGGASDAGTLFSVNTDGTEFTVMHHFEGSDGANPSGGLARVADSFYGTTARGGSTGFGVLFSVTTLPQLRIQRAGSNVMLIWPSNANGFTLQSYAGPGNQWDWHYDWTPILAGGSYVVNIPLSGSDAKQFYRLAFCGCLDWGLVCCGNACCGPNSVDVPGGNGP